MTAHYNNRLPHEEKKKSTKQGQQKNSNTARATTLATV
jgi:hypothetical protein